MARTMSGTALAAMYSQETDECFLCLLEINHALLVGGTIKIVNDWVGHGAYTAYPFDIGLPTDAKDRPPEATLRLDNVDRMLIEAIDAVSTPPDVKLEVVLASDISTVEAGPFEFKMRALDYDVQEITAKLTYEIMLDEPSPGDTMGPNTFPGIFGGRAQEWERGRGPGDPEAGAAPDVGTGGVTPFKDMTKKKGSNT